MKQSVAPAAIIIPTLNRQQSLSSTLQQISELSTLPSEIIVVDQGMRMDLKEMFCVLASKGVRCRYVLTRFKSAACARNIGLILVEAPVAIYIDDDVEIISDFVRSYLEYFGEHPEIVGVAGHMVCRHPAPNVVAENTFQPRETYVRNGKGGNMAFRVSALLELGGLNPLIQRYCEEYELFQRLEKRGMKVLSGENAIIVHLIAQTGGTRETLYKSFQWYTEEVQNNIVRIVKLYSIAFVGIWLLKNYRLVLLAIRAGIAERMSLWSFYNSIANGSKLGRISRNYLDMLPLSCLLAGSQIEGPTNFLFHKDLESITRRAQGLAEITDIQEKLSILRAHVVVDCDVKPRA
jgi:GT2 family glycosyltransferase